MTDTYAIDGANPDVIDATPVDVDAEASDSASAAEREVKGEYIKGELGGREIHVPPVRKWRSSALSALRNGDMQGWAEGTLDDEDWEIWEQVDPNLEEIEAFFGSVNAGLGTNPGNSRASRRQQRSTGRH